MHYNLRCVECGETFEDSEQGFLLSCSENHGPAMLQANYEVAGFEPDDDLEGVFRYHDWLPIRRIYGRSPRTVIFQNEELCEKYNLPNLYFAFNGYWPERDGGMSTCSFKELEAACVMARIPEQETRSIVVASAGNTGRAFLEFGSQYHVNTTVVIPEFAIPQMWTTVPKADCVKLVVLKDADYFDAIQLADRICDFTDRFFPEGGAKNVARRDGMGTVILAATEAIHAIPDHYFQSVGSGTGAIAVWEMAWRLVTDATYGQKLPRLHLSQTQAFPIMAAAWEAHSRALPDIPVEKAREMARAAYSPVLGNRKPPYSLTGGLFDALSETGGIFAVPSNEDAANAGKLFMSLEGIDLDKAAQVCLAAFLMEAEANAFYSDDIILVNLTGGGSERAHADGIAIPATADIFFTKEDMAQETIKARFGF
ncbi:MAG: cysteate synthase [Victivallales bacterium]|nr:cysteate synthase [Victivallales bacterium]